MHAAWTILCNDLRLLTRDRTKLVLTLAWPLAIAIFFGALSPTRESLPLPVAVVAADATDARWIARFVGQLNQIPRVQATQRSGPEATSSLQEARVAAVLTVEETTFGRITAKFGRISESEGQMINLAGQIAQARAGQPAAQHDVEPYVVPPTANRPAHGHDATFPQGMLWAVLSLASKFGMDFAAEERQKTLFRLRIAPLANAWIVVAKSLACWTTMIAVQALVLAVGLILFDVSLRSPALVVGAILAIATCFTGAMTAVAVWARRSDSAGNLTWAIFMTLAMVGGAMVPSYVMPDWMRTLAASSPVFWSLQAIEAGIWNESAADSWYIPILALTALGCGLLGWSARRLAA